MENCYNFVLFCYFYFFFFILKSEIRKKDSAFIGYQSNDIDSVREEMMAIYEALRSLKINYANPPASFNMFQSVRLPSTVLNN